MKPLPTKVAFSSWQGSSNRTAYGFPGEIIRLVSDVGGEMDTRDVIEAAFNIAIGSNTYAYIRTRNRVARAVQELVKQGRLSFSSAPSTSPSPLPAPSVPQLLAAPPASPSLSLTVLVAVATHPIHPASMNIVSSVLRSAGFQVAQLPSIPVSASPASPLASPLASP